MAQTTGSRSGFVHPDSLTVQTLLIVNESPWGSSLPLAALRFAEAATGLGYALHAVYFQHDGVYNALHAAQTDAGTPELSARWAELARVAGCGLWLCSSASQRRMNPEATVSGPFEAVGKARFLEAVAACERVVSF